MENSIYTRFQLKGLGALEKRFLEYVETTSKSSLKFEFLDTRTMARVIIDSPYVHRWTEIYRKRVLARFYKLQNWWVNEGKPPVTMLTLTTYQGATQTALAARGAKVTREEGLLILQSSWRKLRMMMRNRILKRKYDYVYVIEHHKSGYGHMHVCIFDTLTLEEKERISKLWTEKYNAGSLEHGAVFSKERKDERINTSGDGQPIRNRNDISFIGFYLIKYLGKSFANPEEMSGAELKFSALLWKLKIRQYNTSRHLAHIMKLDLDESDERFKCISVILLNEYGEERALSAMEKEEYDELVKEGLLRMRASLDKYGQ